jgi:hypothetical protein
VRRRVQFVNRPPCMNMPLSLEGSELERQERQEGQEGLEWQEGLEGQEEWLPA